MNEIEEQVKDIELVSKQYDAIEAFISGWCLLLVVVILSITLLT